MSNKPILVYKDKNPYILDWLIFAGTSMVTNFWGSSGILSVGGCQNSNWASNWASNCSSDVILWTVDKTTTPFTFTPKNFATWWVIFDKSKI